MFDIIQSLHRLRHMLCFFLISTRSYRHCHAQGYCNYDNTTSHLHVSPSKNGINYVFNGQHTIEIVATVSGSRETPVWCMIYDDLEYNHEADIFANQMKYVKSLLPFEIFQANIEAGNNKQLLIKELVRV